MRREEAIFMVPGQTVRGLAGITRGLSTELLCNHVGNCASRAEFLAGAAMHPQLNKNA